MSFASFASFSFASFSFSSFTIFSVVYPYSCLTLYTDKFLAEIEVSDITQVHWNEKEKWAEWYTKYSGMYSCTCNPSINYKIAVEAVKRSRQSRQREHLELS